MKQKLLNSFTWRGTLLVALLSCAFSVWGQGSTTLTFSSSNTQVIVDDVTWAISGGSYSNNSWSISKNSSVTFTTTSSIKGKITSVVVNARSAQNKKGHVGVKVNGNNLGNTATYTLSDSDENYTFKPTSGVNVDGPSKIVVTGSAENKTIYINSITVTYEAPSVNTFTISANCYGLDGDGNIMKFGTYSNTCQFVLPDGVTASKINVENGKLKLTTLSGIIPANTGILLSAPRNVDGSPTDFSGNVDFRLATATNVSGNMLQPSSAMPLPANAPANTKYYCLRMDGTDIGFYYGADGGGVFEMPDNKAFLAVTTTTAEPEANVQSFSFSDMVNGINAVETEKAESKVIYNLAGQRVSKMQKGIYVVNGKKMLVK